MIITDNLLHALCTSWFLFLQEWHWNLSKSLKWLALLVRMSARLRRWPGAGPPVALDGNNFFSQHAQVTTLIVLSRTMPE